MQAEKKGEQLPKLDADPRNYAEGPDFATAVDRILQKLP